MPVAVAARIALAAVFAVSGVLKLRDGSAGLRSALEGFGVPEGAARRLWWALPAAEMGLAAALTATLRSPAAAWAALGLLSVFTLAVGWALMGEARPACPCFGARSEEPISGLTLARNGVLLAVAVIATG